MRREVRRWQGDSNLSLSSQIYCLQQSTHPARKKFSTSIHIPDYSTHRRLHRFEGAAWCTRNGKSQHVVGLAAQGVYLTRDCLSTGFGHPLWGPVPMSFSSRFSSLVGEICQLKSLRPTNPAAHYPKILALLMPVRSDSARSEDLGVNLHVGIIFPASPDDVLLDLLDSVCANSFDSV